MTPSRPVGARNVGLACCALLAGCGTPLQSTSTLTNLTTAFEASTKAAQETLASERKAKPRLRRAAAIQFYIKNRNNTGSPNADINGADEQASFARYVCAGSNSLQREQNALSSINVYSATLKSIMDPGEDTAAGQIKRLRQQFKPLNPLNVPEKPGENPGKKCISEVQRLAMLWTGVPTTDSSDENAFVAISATFKLIEEAYKAGEVLLKNGTQIIGDVKAKERFSSYVKSNHEAYSSVITRDFTGDRIKAAWDQRKALSLQKPKATFHTLFDKNLKLEGQEQEIKIAAIGWNVNAELAEYDALSGAPEPQNIQNALLEAEGRLYQIATNSDVSLADAVAFLKDLITDLQRAKKAYDEANIAFDKLDPIK